MLQYVSRWFLCEETLKAANAVLVNYHHRLLLSAVWGSGTLSSSDGQRFGIQQSSLLTSFYPRYFGYYERALSVYTHISNQFSVFGTRVISCGPREALYVLDGLLENNTILRLREHTTDTHGFTEHLARPSRSAALQARAGDELRMLGPAAPPHRRDELDSPTVGHHGRGRGLAEESHGAGQHHRPAAGKCLLFGSFGEGPDRPGADRQIDLHSPVS
jgi:hypothetical protein